MQTIFDIITPQRRAAPAGPPRAGAPLASFSQSLTLSESAAAQLRAYLDANSLPGYRVFSCYNFDLHDINTLLKPLGETEAAWEAATPFLQGGESLSSLTYSDSWAWEHRSGFLRLFRHEAVIGRWYWAGTGSEGSLWLIAAPSAEAFAKLRRAVINARREANDKRWQIIGDTNGEDAPLRAFTGDVPVLNEALMDRIKTEIVGFFDEKVAAMYRGMHVPYRRGVLLYGPPGNGKTSLIRWIGANIPQAAAICLRPWAGFDSDDLVDVINRWTSQAPALLVLEDLDWLLAQVNVSTFLNQLDGLNTPANGQGLLLIATTNHPEKLDPAVNNRPGRFDACIELSPPDAALRERFLRSKLPTLAAELLAKLIDGSEGLSFAHLQELLRLSGLRAINAGRTERTAEDVLSSLADVKESHEAAMKGFAGKLEMPFGLGHLHRK